jgi:6-phosphofructokinase 1
MEYTMKTPLSSPPRPVTEIRRVAILFSGGPAPSANAVIGSAASTFSRNGIEVLGIQSGYSHLMKYKPGDVLQEGVAFVRLSHEALEGARNTQGIMIGTARANPGKKLKTEAELDDPAATAPLKTVYDALCSLGVDALISIGGDDTLTTAAKFKLFQDRLSRGAKRIRVVHLPKTIDNDYKGIDFTFGYFTAVEMLATEIYNLLADAKSTGTYYIAQVMGRAAGWLAYGAAIGGEASLVIGLEDILPDWRSSEMAVDPGTGRPFLDPQTKQPILREIFNLTPIAGRIVDVIQAREREGQKYGVIVMAEGIAEFLPQSELRKCLSDDEYLKLKLDEFGHFPVSQTKFSGRIGRMVAEEYRSRKQQEQEAKLGRNLTEEEKETLPEKKVVGLQFGYEVRCHRPTAFDVILGSQLGVGAYRALAERNLNGVMVSVTGQLNLTFEPFENLIDKKTLRAHPRPLKPGEGFHELARYLEVRVEEGD